MDNFIYLFMGLVAFLLFAWAVGTYKSKKCTKQDLIIGLILLGIGVITAITAIFNLL